MKCLDRAHSVISDALLARRIALFSRSSLPLAADSLHFTLQNRANIVAGRRYAARAK